LIDTDNGRRRGSSAAGASWEYVMARRNHRLTFCSTVLLIGSGLLAASPAPGADVIVYDDDAATQFRQLERVYQATTAAHTGSFGLRVEPTY
jgi:hypothetical protein